MAEAKNAASYFVDRHLTEGRGDKTAFVEAGGAGRRISYGDLSQRSGCVADALARIGMRREERAVMLVLDQIEAPEIFWGCLKAGVVPVPLNTMLVADVYQAILQDSRATCLFLSAELADTVLPAARQSPELRDIIVIGDAPDGTTGYDAFLADTGPRAPVSVSPDDVAFWLYSSGSTGLPKGVKHVHSSLKETADTYGAQVLGIRETDVIYSAAKIFFAYGLGNAMTFPMSVGATTVLFNARPTPDAVTDILATQKPSIFCGVPTLYAALIAHLGKHGVPDAPLRVCISAGEALPAETGRTWQALWGVDILDGVGSTEMLHIFLSNAPGNLDYGTSGLAVPGYDLRLVDETNVEVAPGEIGELLVRGASASDGYWNQRAKSRATFLGDWTRTGDKYERRADGRYVYCGRTDDMFKVSGQWVSPFEVEQALTEHPAVLEAAVVAARDAEGLEKPKAYVVLTENGPQDGAALREELQRFVKERVGMWKYPRWVELVSDLPKTATGKIQRFRLRD